MRSRRSAVALLSLTLAWAGIPGSTAAEASAAQPVAAAPAPTQPIAAARSVVRATADEVLAVLADAEIDDAQRRSQIEDIAIRNFDFYTISRLVLARGWKRMTKEQRTEFVDQFQQYLAETYGSRIQRYTQQSVDIVGERLEKNGHVTIQTRIAGAEADGVSVDYRLRSKNEGPWRVIDVTIEGVSVVASFRSQFKELMASGGPEEVLRRLRDKNLPENSAG
ncbi:MAG: ABC transporter substrate-binding protein [Myxococcota bacterium]|nr:ABC transporter substrate-binding protein [Myxococcota bacterium]